jgi:ABC-2 type transport system permease protein
MSGIGVVYRRELKAYFDTPIAAIFIAILVLFMSYWVFFQLPNLFLADRAEMRKAFQVMPWVLLFFAPAITMRVWSDEFRVGTADVLSTLPLRSRDVVIGKYLAAVSVIAASLFFTAAIPLAIEWLGDPDWGPIIGGYAGSLLAGAFFAAIGCFASALNQNQVIAMLIGWSVGLFFLLALPELSLHVESDVLARAIGQLGVQEHFERIERGVISLADLVYFAAGSALFLALNSFAVEWKRY